MHIHVKGGTCRGCSRSSVFSLYSQRDKSHRYYMKALIVADRADMRYTEFIFELVEPGLAVKFAENESRFGLQSFGAGAP